MRSMWNGSIDFGLVSVPAKIYAVGDPADLTAHLYHNADHGRVRNTRTCTACEQPLEPTDIVKGFEVADGIAVVSEDDLATIKPAATRSIEVTRFVPRDQIPPLLIERSYYLGPGDKPKGYALLTAILADNAHYAIGTLTLRSRTRLVALGAETHNGATLLVAHTLLWASELRDASQIPTPQLTISDTERETAQHLVNLMTGDFDHAAHIDAQQEKLRELVAAAPVVTEGTPAQDGKDVEDATVSDLLAKLEASIAAKQAAQMPKARKTRRLQSKTA